MAQLTAKVIKVFADIGATGPSGNYLGVFGSAKEGTKAYSSVPATIQSLTQYDNGIKSALINGVPLAMQEIDALNYLLTTSAKYIEGYGIGFYNASIEYFIGSLCRYGSTIFISKIDNNINNSPTTSTNWAVFFSKEHSNIFDTNYYILPYETMIDHVYNTNTDMFLPEAVAINKGRNILIYNASPGNTKTIKVANSGTINGLASYSLGFYKFVQVRSTGTEWQIISKS